MFKMHNLQLSRKLFEIKLTDFDELNDFELKVYQKFFIKEILVSVNEKYSF